MISADRTVGDQIPTGSAVNLVVASGSVTLVDVVGYTVEAAQRTLTADDVKLPPSVVEDASCPAGRGDPTVSAQ